MNCKGGPVHMVEQVLKGKGTSQVSKLGVKSSFGLLMKAWPQLHPPLRAVCFFYTKMPCRLSGLRAEVKQEDQYESY